MSRLPAIQFYTRDWLADPCVRSCSPASRGVWIDLLSLMSESARRGHLVWPDGSPIADADIARMIGCTKAETLKALAELTRKQVCSRTVDGILYSRRMARDEAERQVKSDAGRLGGQSSRPASVQKEAEQPATSQETEPEAERKQTGSTIEAEPEAERKQNPEHNRSTVEAEPRAQSKQKGGSASASATASATEERGNAGESDPGAKPTVVPPSDPRPSMTATLSPGPQPQPMPMRSAARRVDPPPKLSEADGARRRAFEVFSRLWGEAHPGTRYPSTAADTPSLRTILDAVGGDPDRFAAMAARYFADREPFVVSQGYTLKYLASRIGTYAVDRPPGEQPGSRIFTTAAERTQHQRNDMLAGALAGLQQERQQIGNGHPNGYPSGTEALGKEEE